MLVCVLPTGMNDHNTGNYVIEVKGVKAVVACSGAAALTVGGTGCVVASAATTAAATAVAASASASTASAALAATWFGSSSLTAAAASAQAISAAAASSAAQMAVYSTYFTILGPLVVVGVGVAAARSWMSWKKKVPWDLTIVQKQFLTECLCHIHCNTLSLCVWSVQCTPMLLTPTCVFEHLKILKPPVSSEPP